MGKRKAEGSPWEFQGPEQANYTWLEVSTEEILRSEVEPIEGALQQLGATSVTTELGTSSVVFELVVVPEGPTGDEFGKGVVASGEAPAGTITEHENEAGLHPFWQLLELAGYELLYGSEGVRIS